MKRVKIFTGTDPLKLEGQINQWLIANDKVRIDHLLQSTDEKFLIITIFYTALK